MLRGYKGAAAVTLSVGAFRIRVRLGLGRLALWLCRIWSRGGAYYYVVGFLLTELEILAPCCITCWAASSRLRLARAPVKTKDLPANPRLETAIPQGLKPKEKGAKY